MHPQHYSELQKLQLSQPQKSMDYNLNENLKNIPNMGCHLILDFNDVTTVDMNDYKFMHEFLTDVIVKSGGTIEGHQYKQFEPQGLTILYLLSESHFSIHTWPENGACAIDFYHCGETASKRLKRAEELLCDKFGWDKCTSSILLDRGLRRKHQLNSYNNQTTIFSNLMLIERQKSEYQDIRIYDSKYFGKMLTLNNMIQVVSNSPSTEFSMTLVDPIFENIQDDLENRQIIMIGGGDLEVACYILQKYPALKKLLVIEIDEKVHTLSKQYILSQEQLDTAQKAIESGKLEIQFNDGIQYIQQLVDSRADHVKFDGLIIDCADMLQQYEFTSQFLSQSFYNNVKDLLKPGCVFSHMLSNDKFKRQFKQYVEEAQFKEHYFRTAFQPEFSMPVPIGYGVSP